MNFKISKATREATRLTGAGRLMEATAFIQDMLGGASTAGVPAQDAMTIDGTAERSGAPQISRTPARPGLLGKVSLRDLVRPKGQACAPGGVAAPYGAPSEWVNRTGPSGSRRYKLYVPTGYRTAPPFRSSWRCTAAPNRLTISPREPA